MIMNRIRCFFSLLAVIHVSLYDKAESFSQLSTGPGLVGGITNSKEEAIYRFCSEVDAILQCDNPQERFISFTLNGIKTPRKTKNMSEMKRAQIEREKDNLRGKIRQVQGRLCLLKTRSKDPNKDDESLYIQTTTKFHGATDVAQNCKLSDFTLKEIMSPSSSYLDPPWSSSESEGLGLDGSNRGSPFVYAEMKTVEGTWILDLSKTSKRQMCSFVKSKENVQFDTSKQLSHDKPKNVLLSPSHMFFQKLGITDENGKPKAARSSKLRQCQKFVEIVSRLVDSSKIAVTSNSNHLKVVDMGCGRGYLTFSLHTYLRETYPALKVETKGVDIRPQLMNEVNSIARELGQDFDGLQFMTGSIECANINDRVDILIALHACDTATDDAIWFGIKQNSTIIVTAPCCHKQIRLYLDSHIAKEKNHPYADILRHNIYKERLAETVTDSVRALLLESAGYDVQVFEFIGGEHTSKNVMITAVKRLKPRTESQQENLRQRLNGLAELHGIKRQKLSDLMGESFNSVQSGTTKRRNRMPVL